MRMDNNCGLLIKLGLKTNNKTINVVYYSIVDQFFERFSSLRRSDVSFPMFVGSFSRQNLELVRGQPAVCNEIKLKVFQVLSRVDLKIISINNALKS